MTPADEPSESVVGAALRLQRFLHYWDQHVPFHGKGDVIISWQVSGLPMLTRSDLQALLDAVGSTGCPMTEPSRTHDETAYRTVVYEWATFCLDCGDGPRVHDSETIAREIHADDVAAESAYDKPHRIVLRRRQVPEWEDAPGE